ncbi:hypothetical protein A2753_02975 [Candidatus Uhrbacteria bacterium RIFCSPHIGHO2_01_FULL_47_11]|nr:MAG: hypothetical protein A2753_02975 [Candidatus Uhrbacteria bacterium RIFCSPHIGHO2_01_FULL_47_11]
MKNMIITWLGQSCFKIDIKSQNEEVTIITDPFDPAVVGLKLPRTLTADIVLKSDPEVKYPIEGREGKKPFVIETPGEYEVRGVFVYAIPFSNQNSPPEFVFWIEAEGIEILHTGSLTRVLSETELQAIEGVDLLMVPVGGGTALDAKKAAELASELEARVVMPMLYKVEGLKLKAEGVEPFLKIVGAKSEQMPKFKVTRKDLPADEMKVVVLEKA